METGRSTIRLARRPLWLASSAAMPLLLGIPTAHAATVIANYWDPGHTGTFPGSGPWDHTITNRVQFSGGDNVYRNSSSGGTSVRGAAGTVDLNASGVCSTCLSMGVILADGKVTHAPGAVPAPSTWAAVLTGTGLPGRVLRRRRARW